MHVISYESRTIFHIIDRGINAIRLIQNNNKCFSFLISIRGKRKIERWQCGNIALTTVILREIHNKTS